MPKVSDIFDVQYGHSLELNRLTQTSQANGVAFISRKMRDNGIIAYVEKLPKLDPAPAGELTCALSGNGVLSAFVQSQPFYTAFHVARLSPKSNLSTAQLLYFCMCLKANRYRYSYGRQANRTLRDLVVPDPSQAPEWVDDTFVNIFETWPNLLQGALKESQTTLQNVARKDLNPISNSN